MTPPPVRATRVGKVKTLLRPRSISDDNFAPFGKLVRAGMGPPSFERPYLKNWRLPFYSDRPARLQIMRYDYHRPIVFSKLERHLFVTEMRYPTTNASAVLIVAGYGYSNPPNDNTMFNSEGESMAEGLPYPDTVQAFILDGSTGVLFYPGIWHGLDCYSLKPPHADYLFLSDTATENEIEALVTPVSGNRTEVYDFIDTHDMSFEVVVPATLS